jgi:hypothetical protein
MAPTASPSMRSANRKLRGRSIHIRRHLGRQTASEFTALNDELPEFGRTGTSLVSISAGGGAAKPIPGTVNGYGPVFSPDGRTVAFARQQERHGRSEGEDNFESVSVWLADLRTGKSTPLTPWRTTSSSFRPRSLLTAHAWRSAGGSATGLPKPSRSDSTGNRSGSWPEKPTNRFTRPTADRSRFSAAHSKK